MTTKQLLKCDWCGYLSETWEEARKHIDKECPHTTNYSGKICPCEYHKRLRSFQKSTLKSGDKG